MKILALVIFSLVMGCAMNKVEKEFGPLKHVDYVDTAKYMGDWYVIANIPTYFEKGAHNAVESYKWNEADQRIDVDFHYNKNSADGEVKHIPQKAFIYDEKSHAEWRVQPIWPLKFAYLIIDIAPDYSYTVVGVPNRKNLWIMARKPSMDPSVLASIKQKVATVGYDLSKIEMVPQDGVTSSASDHAVH